MIDLVFIHQRTSSQERKMGFPDGFIKLSYLLRLVKQINMGFLSFSGPSVLELITIIEYKVDEVRKELIKEGFTEIPIKTNKDRLYIPCHKEGYSFDHVLISCTYDDSYYADISLISNGRLSYIDELEYNHTRIFSNLSDLCIELRFLGAKQKS